MGVVRSAGAGTNRPITLAGGPRCYAPIGVITNHHPEPSDCPRIPQEPADSTFMDSTGAPRNGIGAPESESSSTWEKMGFMAEGI